MDAPAAVPAPTATFKARSGGKGTYRKRTAAEAASGSGDEAAGGGGGGAAAAAATQEGPKRAAVEADAGGGGGGGGAADEEEDSPAVVAARLEEARALQKYRRRELGISAGTLTRDVGGSSAAHGTGAARGSGNRSDDDFDSKIRNGGGLVSGATKMGLNTAFTQQTKALDVDQHMVEYVEKEMKKRKGIADDVQPTAKDYFADLYTVPEHLRVDRPVVEPTEGSALPVSGGILAMIPEVDLGIESKLQNIEDTERAKAMLLEKRRQAASDRRTFDPSATLTGSEVIFARNFRPTRGRGGGPAPSGGSGTSSQLASYANQITRELTGGDWREGRASDEIVMDRFKRREMQFWGGRGRGRR